MKTDHVKMLCDIGELAHLFTASMSLESFLNGIVEMVAHHMQADVCSIYLFEERNEALVLTATHGLNPDSIGKVRLSIGEGLVGLALKELRPICENRAPEHPNFKFFSGIYEEYYESFLAVPILKGNLRLGVLVVQRGKQRYFDEQDTMAMRALSSQLASIIENIRILISPKNQQGDILPDTVCPDLKFIKGKAAAEGFALGRAAVLKEERDVAWAERSEKNYTQADFISALKATEQQLEELQRKVEEKLSDAASLIFSAHLLMLKDKELLNEIEQRIQDGENALQAIEAVFDRYEALFLKHSSSLLREKAYDIKDLKKRVLDNLINEGKTGTKYNGQIVITKEILPSDLLKLSVEGVQGLILVSGGVTSHLAILSRSLQIPLIIAAAPNLLYLPDQTTVLMDADLGNIYVNPSEEIVTRFQERNEARKQWEAKEKIDDGPTLTKDGKRIMLMANINLLSDLKLVARTYADGIGLYRTEFPFLIRNTFPSEEEQLVIYRKLIDGMPDKPIIFRTLDIGGDKVLSYYDDVKEQNPFLGLRSIRFSLKHIDIFKQQIRAILRAGVAADIRIMFPMISSLEEFCSAKAVIDQCRKELRQEKIPHHRRPLIGVMVEIPSLVEVVDALAKVADFISIGTNDLVQYMLAVDRTNEKVADLYIAHHPAILKALKRIADAAKKENKAVSVCGDMAHEERYIPYLLGIGIHTLSVDPIYLPRLKGCISSLDLKQAQKVAHKVCSVSKIEVIARLLGFTNE